MSHLRIAEDLLERIPGLDPEMFAIGSIGPDSGRPDENWQNFDPPKKVSHFENLPDSSGCADLDFYHQYMQDVDPEDVRRRSFLLGYFFHLITDNLWAEKIWRPHKARHSDWYERERDSFIIETKRDWYGLDFIYLRDNPDTLFQRVFLDAVYDEAYLPYMAPAAFEHQINYIKTFYQRKDERVEASYTRAYEYLSAADMDAFVAETVDYLVGVYERFVVGQADTGDAMTVLEIFPG